MENKNSIKQNELNELKKHLKESFIIFIFMLLSLLVVYSIIGDNIIIY